MPGPGAVLRAPAKRRGGHSLLTSTENLLDVEAIGTEQGDDPNRWEQGFQFLPNCESGSGVWLPCEVDPDGKAVPAASDAVVWEPTEFYAGFRCSTWARDRLDMEARGVDALARSIDADLEYEFWTGEAAQDAGNDNPYLAAAGATLVQSGNEVAVNQALALLQQALADCLGSEPGTIHAPRHLVSLWEDLYGVHRDVDADGVVRLYDTFGNTVIGGAGYDGRGPGEAAPPADDTLLWAYATGPTYHLLGEVQVYADEEWMVLDRETNDELWRAERVAAAVWNGCCRIAVLVDTCATCCQSDTGS